MTGPWDPVRDELVKLRCTSEEKRQFELLAAREGLTVSDLIRRRVFEHEPVMPSAQPVSLFGADVDDF
jgi:hypothetical protein